MIERWAVWVEIYHKAANIKCENGYLALWNTLIMAMVNYSVQLFTHTTADITHMPWAFGKTKSTFPYCAVKLYVQERTCVQTLIIMQADNTRATHYSKPVLTSIIYSWLASYALNSVTLATIIIVCGCSGKDTF